MNKTPKNELLRIIKKIKLKGKCLSINCINKPIKSHAISQSLLKLISKNGEVIVFENNFFNARNPEGTIKEKKQGIAKATTFPGFCSYHDNYIFEEIDNLNFDLSGKQAFLYLFRSLSKAIIQKEQSITLLNEAKKIAESNNLNLKLNSFELGILIGMMNLTEHKLNLDSLLSNNDFKSIRFTLFHVEGMPDILFSGATFLDYDFQGNQIQNISRTDILFGLLAFSSVKLEEGWGILFVWDSKSDYACLAFFNSLKEYTKESKENAKLPEALARFIITRCDCTAINIDFWEKLNNTKKKDILSNINNIVKYPSVETKDNLLFGIENIFNFKVSKVSENY
ncbi:hypothetical protein [Leptospira terpstrae]|nr:hypothetical protein [Leptospira terpstrae]